MVIIRYEHAFSLILLDMLVLDVIIGINWLTSFRTVNNCYAQCMTFITSEGTQ